RKLVAITMLVTCGALLLASAALILSDRARFRDEMKDDLTILGQIVANNSTAAVTFGDQKAAAETLGALIAKSPIVAAAMYTSNGRLLAFYRRAGEERRPLPPRPGKDGSAAAAGSLGVFLPVMLQGERVGTVYLESDFSEMNARLRLQTATVSAICLVSALAALLLSSGLQQFISRPILHLAQTAQAVSERQDYSIRAVKQTADELGQLVDAFNQMLQQIQERDSALSRAKEELEGRVEERTERLRQELGERRRAEQELAERNTELHRSNQDLDDFAYIASHDLKEPLRGIHNFAAFLLEDYGERFDEEGRSKLETLTRLSRRMEVLIDSLLHFSRLGRVDLAIEDADLNEVVAEVVDSLGISLRASGVEIRIPHALPVVRCDGVRVRELYHNLVINAMKYNDKAEKWIEVGALPAAGSGPPALYVQDNGIGIQEKHFDAIFRIFKRLHGRDRFGGGTGAGLTIVKKIVERHNGRIWVESVVGEGTAIYFTLEREA
ncbi:MAG TPA: ATP-binding protein, partial [Thermoanaerobaculia bacterium]